MPVGFPASSSLLISTSVISTLPALYTAIPVIGLRQNDEIPASQASKSDGPCTAEHAKVRQALESVPQHVDGQSPELKALLDAKKELGTCSLAEAKKTENPQIKSELLQQALFNNKDNNKNTDKEIRHLISIIDKKQLTTQQKLDLKLAGKVITEAKYHSQVARGVHAPAEKLWNKGISGKVTVDGVDTAYHFIKSNEGEQHPLIMIAPGRGEPMKNYMEIVSEFNAAGRDVIVVGFTGNGDIGKAGHLEHFPEMTSGLAKIIEQRNNITGLNHNSISLVGHSTGGTVAARYCERKDSDRSVTKLTLISPLFKLNASDLSVTMASAVDTVLNAIDNTVNSFLTPFTSKRLDLNSMHIDNRESYYDKNTYSQSPERLAQLVKIRDEHKVMPPSFSWVNEVQHATHLASINAGKLKDKVETLVFVAGKDSVVDNKKTLEFIEKSNATGVIVEGGLHTLTQEADPYRGPMMQEILKFTNNNSTN